MPGDSFGPVAVSASALDPDGDPVQIRWELSASHTPPSTSEGVDPAVLGTTTGLLTAPTSSPAFSPSRLGTWSLHFNASDGCTISR